MSRPRSRFWLAIAIVLPAAAQAQVVTLTPGDDVVAPKTRLGIGVNGGGGWTHFVGAILVDDPSFEGPADGNGFARDGWPWFTGGTVSASVDSGDAVTGSQSQRIVVTGAPAHMSQARTDLPQAPLTMRARAGHRYRIRVQARSDVTGARIRLGVLDEGWGRTLGPELPVTTTWQIYTWDYAPAADHLLRGVAVGFVDAATFWLDDLVAWDLDDLDAATGLSATFVQRLVELAPATLRLGGLGVNGIPLEAYLRPGWALDYGPPALQPDLDLDSFLALCQRVGAQPFITVPPAFSDAASWPLGDLTDDVIANHYADHGNLIDYLGGDASTTYGARREARGHGRWDQRFDAIYLELGNELWGTPDDHWDMDPNNTESQAAQMQNYATYCERRATEMKARPGWRANMQVGFGGRGPTLWMGGWPGSYDGTLVPAIGGLVDFSTIDLYYGAGAASDTDATIYAALFAHAPRYEREIAAMRTAFKTANGGVDLPTMVYEGNATWGGYEADLGNPSNLYFKSVSLGAAVSLIDVYAAANRAGLVVNNHFHYGGNVWGATGPYPEVLRKPAYYALQLFNRQLAGELVRCDVQGSSSYDETLTGEASVPHVACYPYRDGQTWHILVVNRHLSEARSIHVARRLAPLRRVLLTGASPALTNEVSEVVQLQETTLPGALVDAIDDSVPPASALVLIASETAVAPTDGGAVDVRGADANPPHDAAAADQQPLADGSAVAADGGGTDTDSAPVDDGGLLTDSAVDGASTTADAAAGGPGDGGGASLGSAEGCACRAGTRRTCPAGLLALLAILGTLRRRARRALTPRS